MPEILVKFDEPITSPSGDKFFAQAVGKAVNGELWEGWIEFLASDGGEPIASGRESTQPNRTDLEYWAQGLTKVYLQGALARAISLAERDERDFSTSNYDKRAFNAATGRSTESSAARGGVTPRAILDPFKVYAQGEEILRRELNALSRDHLESISSAYRIGASRSPGGVRSGSTYELIESIVTDVRGTRGRVSSGGESEAQL
jgi:hypothetical protein